MAVVCTDNVFLSLDADDLSNRVKSVTINEGHESVDPTTMGANTRLNKASLKTWSIEVTFAQDYAASEVDARLSAIYAADPPESAIIVRPDTGGVSATNPQWAGTGVLMSYSPITGAVGDFHEVTVTFEAAGDLTRTTS